MPLHIKLMVSINELKLDLATYLAQSGYKVENSLPDISGAFYISVFMPDKKEVIAQIYKQNNFYLFLVTKNVYWGGRASQVYLPDDSIYVGNTFYIINNRFRSFSFQPTHYLDLKQIYTNCQFAIFTKNNMKNSYLLLISR